MLLLSNSKFDKLIKLHLLEQIIFVKNLIFLYYIL